MLALTPAGARDRRASSSTPSATGWSSQLGGWSPEQHAELEQVLTRLSRALLGDEADRHLADR